jgi:hypothetical protein
LFYLHVFSLSQQQRSQRLLHLACWSLFALLYIVR